MSFVGVAQNLISNGDFETGDNSSWGGIKNLSAQTETVYAGTYTAEISGEAYFSQTPSPTVSDGKAYKFTCYAKANVPGDNAYMAAQYRPGGGAYEYLNYVNLSASDWTEFSFVVNLTAYELTNFRLGFYKPSGGSAQHIDNISVEEIDASLLESGNDIESSSIGVIDSENKKISGINRNAITASQLLNALTLTTNATAIVSSPSGEYTNPSSIITDDHTIRVFAESGTFQNYTIETSNKTIRSIVNGDEATLDNTNFRILNITPVLTVSEFINILELYEGATVEMLNAADQTVVLNQSSTNINEAMLVRVTGNTGYTDYTLQLREVETINTIVSINEGTLNESVPSVQDMINGISVVQLKSLITVAKYASFVVTDDSGTQLQENDTVEASHKIRVLAENGSERIYSIEFGSISIQNKIYIDQHVEETKLDYQNITLEGASELKITSVNDAFSVSTVNINSENAWLMFENIKPSVVRDNYLEFITSFGQPAVLEENIRIVQYVNGAVVIPHATDYEAVEIFDEENLTGNSMKLTPYTYNKIAQLGDFNDGIASFKVKRGYYVTLAQNEDGTGYSKVFIAHDKDLIVNTMPVGLENKVSFARVIPWRWPTKKGHPGHGQNTNLNIGWTYNWSAGGTSSLDIEYVPIRHNLNWPGYGSFTSKEGSTHMLAHNEPDRPDQANATVDQVLAQWPKLMESGLRIGSPSPADNGLWWLYDFIDRCDELNYRVDFVAIHWYRGCQSAQSFYNYAKAVHDRTGRPVWITEWNNGANWTSCKPQSQTENAAKVKAFIEKLNTAPWVERYCIFPYLGTNWTTANNNGLTETGVAYRDNDAPMAFNPNEEYPNAFKRLTTPTNLEASWNENEKSMDLTWNDVSDYENGVRIERNENNKGWVEIARIEMPDITFYSDDTIDSFGDYKYRVRQMIVGTGNSPYSNEVKVSFVLEGDANIALGKNTSTSSDRASSGYTGSKAVDGDISTNANRWLTANGASYPHWIEIDLAGTYEISGLKFYTGYSGYGSPLTDFKFQYWNGIDWEDILNVTGNISAEYVEGFQRLTTTKVRLYITNAADSNTVKLFEIEVYGKELSLDVNHVDLQKLIHLYPNPVKKDFLNIKGFQHIDSFEVYNSLGVQLDLKFDRGRVYVGSLPSGTYFVRINGELSMKFLKH